jgi:hypothetical protein
VIDLSQSIPLERQSKPLSLVKGSLSKLSPLIKIGILSSVKTRDVTFVFEQLSTKKRRKKEVHSLYLLPFQYLIPAVLLSTLISSTVTVQS